MENIDNIMITILVVTSVLTMIYLAIKWNVIGNIDCPQCKNKDSYTEPRATKKGSCLKCNFSETESEMMKREELLREQTKSTVDI